MPFGHGVCANTIKLADSDTQTDFFSIFSALRYFDLYIRNVWANRDQ